MTFDEKMKAAEMLGTIMGTAHSVKAYSEEKLHSKWGEEIYEIAEKLSVLIRKSETNG